MTDAVIAVTILWIFVFIYSIAASIDFGSGFWAMVYRNKPLTHATQIANRYLSPSWEVTNVFVVLIVVALVSFFPKASYTLGTVLLLPGSLILLLLLVRSAFLVYSHYTKEYKNMLIAVSGISGLLIPALLISVLPITQGGFIVTYGDVQRLHLGRLFTSLNGYAFMGFAITTTLFLSSLLLSDYSDVAEEKEAYRIYRRDALILGPVTMAFALFIIYAINREAHWLYTQLTHHLPWMYASVIVFLIGYAMLWFHIPRLAVISVVLQYFFAGYAYGAAHLPWIVHPLVTIYTGFTNQSMYHALLISYLVGFAILIPGFIYFWRMFMQDHRYVKR